MNQEELRVQARSTPRLVWLVTLLGFSAGVIMLGIVYWALSSISKEREKLDTLQVEMTRMVTSLDPYLVQARDDLVDLLDRKPVYSSDSLWIDRLMETIQKFSGLGMAPDLAISNALYQLLEQIKVLKAVREECVVWAEKNAKVNEELPLVRKRIDSYLREMRAAVASAEGRQRLSHALQFRKFRDLPEGKGETVRLAREIIDGMSQSSEMSSVKAELSDLALLCERLAGEDQIDDLADLKDNELTSTLNRLRRSMNSSVRGIPAPDGEILLKRLEEFEVALFGEGYFIDAVHQTVILGRDGLYILSRERLSLRQERQRLLSEVTRLFDDFHNTRQQLGECVEVFAKETAIGAERAIKQAWNTMFFVWFVSMIVFLVLSARIARTVKQHVRAFEATNRDLDIRTQALSRAIQDLRREIEERQRVEDALRESEDALRRAKDGLEMRVEERTSDLRNANRLLEREIAERNRVEGELRQRGGELAAAFESARKAREIAEAERDRSEKMLLEVSESKRRLEILLSDATAREMRMVELKREVNDLLIQLGREAIYDAPYEVEAFMAGRKK